MSISSGLAHKYDEFDEFPQQSAPKTAYEELKAWCEKHLDKSQWRAIKEDEWGDSTIDIGEATHIFSQDTGRYLHTVFYN